MADEGARKSCTYNNRTYKHGALLCLMEKCMTCNDGKWERKSWPTSTTT